VILRRRVRHHFHALDRIRGYLIQRQRTGAAVDKDGRTAVAHAYVAVDVHIHRWHLAQYICGRTAHTREVLIYVKNALIDLHRESRLLAHHFHAFQRSSRGFEPDIADVATLADCNGFEKSLVSDEVDL